MKSWVVKIMGILLIVAVTGFFITQAMAFEARTNNERAVRVDVKPVQLKTGETAIFELRLNTHSVNLDYDLVQICVLQDGNGKQYNAVKWDGSPRGGHHRSGKLEFPKLEGNPPSVKLIVKNISGVPERIFEWKLAQAG
jgi:hypothetical protein